MEIIKFLKVVKKYLLVLMALPIIAAIAAYFFAKNLPDVYSSRSRIATGIVDQTAQILTSEDFAQETKVNQQFSNLIQILQLKRNLQQVGYKLILHDLTNDTPY
jgi:polysaccharide biosynthesis transport protein